MQSEKKCWLLSRCSKNISEVFNVISRLRKTTIQQVLNGSGYYLIFITWGRRQRQPTPVLLPGGSHRWRSLMGCSPWGREELDMTERLHFHFSFRALEKEIATHSSVLAWRNPGTGEPGGLPSTGSHRVGHD